MTAVYTRLQARTARPLNLRPQSMTRRKPVSRRARWAVGGNVIFMAVLLIAPLAALALRTIGEGVQPLAELFVNRRGSYFYVPPIVAIRNSLAIAGITVAASLALGFIAASFLAGRGGRSRSAATLAAILDPVFMLPLGTSAVTLGRRSICALRPRFCRWRTRSLRFRLSCDRCCRCCAASALRCARRPP
jgi:thiamine transport system permease protein